MARVLYLHQLRSRNDGRRALPQLRIVAHLRAHRLRRAVAADGGPIALADDQQHRHAQIGELMEHRLSENHVGGERRIPCDPLTPMAWSSTWNRCPSGTPESRPPCRE